jgi:hypothetical protein
VGNYTVNVSTGEGSPLLAMGALDLNSLDTAPGVASGPLKVEWSENGITTVYSAWTMQWGETLSAGTGGNVAFTAYESNTNAFFARTNTIGMIGPFGSGVDSGARRQCCWGDGAVFAVGIDYFEWRRPCQP